MPILLVARGYGALVPAITVLLGAGLPLLLSAIFHYEEVLWVCGALSFLASGVIVWRVGRANNTYGPEPAYRDAVTGRTVRISSRHTFMFVPMEWWAIPIWVLAAICTLFAVLLAFSPLIK